jgi:hypothetical protein
VLQGQALLWGCITFKNTGLLRLIYAGLYLQAFAYLYTNRLGGWGSYRGHCTADWSAIWSLGETKPWWPLYRPVLYCLGLWSSAVTGCPAITILQELPTRLMLLQSGATIEFFFLVSFQSPVLYLLKKVVHSYIFDSLIRWWASCVEFTIRWTIESVTSFSLFSR